MTECAGLEIRYTHYGYRGFESLTFRFLIVMESIRGEWSIAELCHKYGISDSIYYKWNKDFIKAGESRLEGDMLREATSDDMKELRQENIRLKEALADLVVRYDVVKKLETHCINPMHESYMHYSAEEKGLSF